MYEFHGKIEKDLDHHWKQENVTNKVAQGSWQRDIYHAHSRGAFRTQSNI